MTLNNILTCGEIQLCTNNQRWNMEILTSEFYCIFPVKTIFQVCSKILQVFCKFFQELQDF